MSACTFLGTGSAMGWMPNSCRKRYLNPEFKPILVGWFMYM